MLATSNVLIPKPRLGISLRHILPLFCSVAAWTAPTIAFYRRDSLWAAFTAGVLAALTSKLIYRHNWATRSPGMAPPGSEDTMEGLRSRRLPSLKIAAVLLQFSALFLLASLARPATFLLAIAIFIIAFCYLLAIAWSPIRSRYQKVSHTSVAVALAMVFVAASLTPYLAVEGEKGSGGTGSDSYYSRGKGSQGESKPRVLQYLEAFFRAPAASDPRRKRQNTHNDKRFPAAPYPVLQALFGERKPTVESESIAIQNRRKNRKSTALVTDDSYPGMILRPPVEDHAPIVPPVARRKVFENRPSDRKADPVSIPFYGAYWYFRASDGTLPADSVESRGDPASTSFKTTDFSPIAMEARENFGTSIDLSCCRSVELVISNGDRRPGTVAVELILVNTRFPGEPQQSLGICPVTSTQRWSSNDDKSPVTETLSFRLPPHTSIRSFDEATIRFQMRSPRERWSAKIAVLKFRLIPRGL